MSDGIITNGIRFGVLNRKEAERVQCLLRRVRHLEARIARRLAEGAHGDQVGFDRSEASALRWAIETITGEAVPT
jgi:hypothetical protein